MIVIKRNSDYFVGTKSDIQVGDEVFAHNEDMRDVLLSGIRLSVASDTGKQQISEYQDLWYNVVTTLENGDRPYLYQGMYILKLQKWVFEYRHGFGANLVSGGDVCNIYIGEKPKMVRSILGDMDYCRYEIDCDCDCVILSLYCPQWIPAHLMDDKNEWPQTN